MANLTIVHLWAQIAAGENVYVFDVLELSKAGQIWRLFDLLEVMMCSTSFLKVMHDLGSVVHMLKTVCARAGSISWMNR
jgi:hypothetical protein